MKTLLDTVETMLFVALLLALCIALAFGVGTVWFGTIPRLVIVLYALLGSSLLVARYRLLGRSSHTVSILILVSPFLYLPFGRALVDINPGLLPAFMENYVIYAPLVLIPLHAWTVHARYLLKARC